MPGLLGSRRPPRLREDQRLLRAIILEEINMNDYSRKQLFARYTHRGRAMIENTLETMIGEGLIVEHAISAKLELTDEGYAELKSE